MQQRNGDIPPSDCPGAAFRVVAAFGTVAASVRPAAFAARHTALSDRFLFMVLETSEAVAASSLPRHRDRGKPLPRLGPPSRGPPTIEPPDHARLDAAIRRLVEMDPEASAASRLAPWQATALATALAVAAALLVVAPGATIGVLFGIATLASLALLVLRVAARRALGRGAIVVPRAGADLPVYSLLVPLYREETVAGQLVAAIDALDYPRERLDVLLIVEEDDAATLEAVHRARPGPHMRVIVVPDGSPRTKPRALAYGLGFARGSHVVVYDAEDQPEPDQLRKALAAFAGGGPRLGCVQAHLNIYNPRASWLTRHFTLEYTALFDGILPALERHGLPVLLGGTSNHFPRTVLDAVGGWDPYNVTEDADLGLRLARRGYRVGVLPSTTWEEAPERADVWLGQRTRWLKGWMQTYLVHMRRPAETWRQLGTWQFLGFNLLTGGVVLSALVHPWIYLALVWDAAAAYFNAADARLGGPLVWTLAAFNLALNYWVAMALARAAAMARGHRGLAWTGLSLPVYWLAISAAAHRALLELVTAPHHWRKTEHAGRAARRTARDRAHRDGPGGSA
jgi:cellulose synthase/poly-beta-1,6-N-acetylglucosamine synthase-like glycosyltransferase